MKTELLENLIVLRLNEKDMQQKYTQKENTGKHKTMTSKVYYHWYDQLLRWYDLEAAAIVRRSKSPSSRS